MGDKGLNPLFFQGFLAAKRLGHRFRPGADVEFFVDPADVGADGLEADAKFVGNLLVHKALAEEVQDFLFPGYTAQVSYHYNNDAPSFHFDRNGFLVRPDPAGVFTPHGAGGTFGEVHLGVHQDRDER